MNLLPEDNDRMEIVLGYTFGFSVLAVYFILSLVIAIGHVQKETSYGLDVVLPSLGPLGGAFVGWAFGRQRNGKKPL